MDHSQLGDFRDRLLAKRVELNERLKRINANIRRPLDANSKERAQEVEGHEVVDALGNEARGELAKIASALQLVESGEFGTCMTCGGGIGNARLEAYPYAKDCIECAKSDERGDLDS